MVRRDERELDLSEMRDLSERVVGYKAGEFVSLMIHLGDRLGLYGKMANAGPITADQLARWTGLNERWVLEWLRGQAAAQLLAYRGKDRFELTPVAEAVLAEHKSPFYCAGFFPTPTPPDVVNRLVDGFQTGVGMSWQDHGPEVSRMLDRITRPQHRLMPYVLATLPEVEQRLHEGVSVLEVGCRAGGALSILAPKYPKSTFHGYDASPQLVEQAEAAARKEGLSNVTYHLASGQDVPPGPRFDLVLTVDSMHDVPQPADVIRAIRLAIKPDGTWIIKDMRTSSHFEENLESPFSAMFYAFSVLYSLSASLSEPGGSGLGTMGFTSELARELTAAAGFTRFRKLDFDDGFNHFYEVRP
jgi:2-polyprenyl-3-methyl-5-hydroxy-6-metoxy-1,4-benzoquinol methylase